MTLLDANPINDPRIEHHDGMTVIGAALELDSGGTAAIPGLWQRHGMALMTLDGRAGDAAFGVCRDLEGGARFEYIACVATRPDTKVPDGMVARTVPAGRYAVFEHSGHVSDISATFNAIYANWFPTSGHDHADGPDFERYDDRFDPQTGMGLIEIWVPLKAA